jgi:hypothetical protein
MKQIPLMAYESFEQPTYGFKNLIKRVFRFYNLNTIIPQFRISNTDMEFAQRDGSEKFFYYHMSNLEDDQIDSVDGRIIVIGNFEDKDIHSTMLEKMNGPLIIVNILEGLYEGDNWISLPFLLTTYLVYFFVALYTLAKLTKDYLPHDKKISMNNEHSKPFKRFFYYVFHTIREFILEEKNHFILFIYVIICLTFFHHYIYFLSAEIYILLLSFFIKAWRYSEV